MSSLRHIRDLCLVTLLVLAANAPAVSTVHVYQSGPDVMADGSGTVNTAGFNNPPINRGNYANGANPSIALITVGTGRSEQWLS